MAETAVTKFVLDENNWHTWSRKMKAYLIRHNWWSPNQLPTDGLHTNLAQAEMLLRVQDEFISLVDEAANAREAWVNLRSAFEKTGAAQRVRLRAEMNALRMAKHETITAYIDRAKLLRKDLLAAGSQVEDFEVVEAVLMGLPKEYDVIRQILISANDTDITLTELRAELAAREAQLEKQGQDEVTALMSASKGKDTRTCYHCGKKGHIARNCWEKTKQRDAASMLAVRDRDAARGAVR